MATLLAAAAPGRANPPRIEFFDALATAKQVYRESHGLQSLGLGLTTNANARRARKIVKELAKGTREKYGLDIRMVSKRERIPGLTSAAGGNPAKWDEAANVIYVREGMTPTRLLRQVGHEYGAFLLGLRFGGRQKIPRIGEEGSWLTHVLDDVIKTDGQLR